MPAFDVSGWSMAYEDTGSGPAVVLLHGLLMDRSMWEPQVTALRESYRVITLDAPGHGESGTTSAGYTFDQYAADVLGMLDHLGVDRAVVGGQSMGGWTALRCAAARPDRVRGLVLVDTSAGPEDPDKVAQYEAFLNVALADGVGEDLAGLLLMILFGETFAAADAADPWRAKFTTSDPARFEVMTRAVLERDDWTGRLGEISCPAIVFHGEEDIAIEMARAESLAEALSASLHRVPQAGHASSLERPSAVTPALRTFLDALPE